MATTNKTPNYDLPQWVANDKVGIMANLNPAFATIDEKLFEAVTNAENASTTASTANTTASEANKAVGIVETDVTELQADVLTLKNLVNSLAKKITENTTWETVAVTQPTTEILEGLPKIEKMGNNFVSIYLSSFVKNKPASITINKPLCITSLRPKNTRYIVRGCTVSLSDGSTKELNLTLKTDGSIVFSGNVENINSIQMQMVLCTKDWF
jgi:hypothetical protein